MLTILAKSVIIFFIDVLGRKWSAENPHHEKRIRLKYKYTNENIRKKIKDDEKSFYISIAMISLAVFLIFISLLSTYKDLFTDRKINPDNFHIEDDTIYSAEITETPVEVYPHYYAVRTDKDVILMRGIKEAIKEQQVVGYVKVKGILKNTHSKAKASAEKYFIDNNIYSSENMKKHSSFFMDCDKISFTDRLTDEHPVGMVFGITLLVFWAMWESVSRSINAIKHLRPNCGSIRFTHQEIDDQANLPNSKWISSNDVYITPKIVIGLNRGLTAVEYSDIEKIYVKKKRHTESNKFRKRPFKRTRKKYYTYKVIAVTGNKKRLTLCENRGIDQQLRPTINEKCVRDVWADD